MQQIQSFVDAAGVLDGYIGHMCIVYAPCPRLFAVEFSIYIDAELKWLFFFKKKLSGTTEE